uniref:Putative monooxygenase GME11364 n=1 Tax=Pestalotiopsis microspora TaxID=85828 RepID=GME64_PESMI|nr:RecName: Full=Putative monooxygenase GME11364; AltName: Full=Dibenzodioxocinones biosynthesis cluster protein GME11364 [Pestalotiopsis microspora]QED41495.1 monooxygenase domain-containing protein [Pestalotiopsis microspora]
MAAKPTPSVSVHIRLTVDPNKINEFLEISRPMFDAVTAEPLNTFFEMYRDDKTPGVFKLVENWDADIDYMMNVQVKKEYYTPYHTALREILLKPHEVELYSRMPGNEWAKLDVKRYVDQE